MMMQRETIMAASRRRTEARGRRGPRPRPKRFDDCAKTVFLAVLEERGTAQAAADAAGVSRQTCYDHANPHSPRFDREFAEAWAVSHARFVAQLYEAALRRATDGWLEPIIGGKNRDKVVALKPVFDARLLELMLKRHDPTFRNKVEATKHKERSSGAVQKIDLALLTQEERGHARALIEASLRTSKPRKP